MTHGRLPAPHHLKAGAAEPLGVRVAPTTTAWLEANQLNRRGVELKQQGKLQAAVRVYEQALELAPGLAEAHYNLGLAYHDQKEFERAERSFRQALELRADVPQIYFCLGNLYGDQQRLAEAAAMYRQAIRLKPDYAEAHFNFGNMCARQGDADTAVEHYRWALRVRPQYPEVLTNLGNALVELGQLQAAVDTYRQALRGCPEHAETWANLGHAFKVGGNLRSALACYQKSAQIEPDELRTELNLGNTYKDLGDYPGARQAFERAMRLEPAQVLHKLRPANLCPLVFEDREEIAEYLARLDDQLAQMEATAPRWTLEELNQAATEPSFHLQFLHNDLRPVLERYARLFAPSLQSLPLEPRTGKPHVGLVVTRGHEGIFLRSLRGVLERLNLREMHVTIVCARSGVARMREAVVRDEIAVLGLPQRFECAVQRIRDARFDVLYFWEIGTDAVNYFLPMLRLAPVQCTSWGRQITSGIASVDYYLSSDLIESPGAQEHYTERLLRASTLLTYQFLPASPTRASGRADFGLPDSGNLYLCAQNLGKFHPDFDQWLAQILDLDSRGWLVITSDNHGYWAQRLEQRLRRSLGPLAARVVLLPRLKDHAYRQLISLADVLLDPPHFGGVNSTYDALALGKPVVTLPTAYHRGRYTLGCYRKMQMMECVATSAMTYARKAVELATQPDYRHEVCQTILERRHCLFADQESVSEHERLFTWLLDQARSH